MRTLAIPFSVMLIMVAHGAAYAGGDLMVSASTHICAVAKEKNKSRLALYPVTSSDGEENSTATTRMLSGLLACSQITVIDKSKTTQVADEQALGQTGLLDEASAPAVGKMIGADALIFCSASEKEVQVRIIDASTGQVIGATAVTGGSASKPRVEKVKSSKNELQQVYLKRWLRRAWRKRPALFLYATSTEAEWLELKDRYPARARKVAARVDHLGKREQARIKSAREEVRRLRRSHPKINRHIKRARAKIIISRAHKKHKKRRRKGEKRGRRRHRR